MSNMRAQEDEAIVTDALERLANPKHQPKNEETALLIIEIEQIASNARVAWLRLREVIGLGLP